MERENIKKPDDWPKNDREWKTDALCDKLEEFKKNPNYITRERLLALVGEHDLNEYSSLGLERITDYEVAQLNYLYLASTAYHLNSIKVYLYDLITETTRIHKMATWCNPIIGKGSDEDLFIDAYNGLILPLKLYYLVYLKYTTEKSNNFSVQLISVVRGMITTDSDTESINNVTHAYVSMMNDLSYMRGSKKQVIWQFSREELKELFKLEAELMRLNKNSPIERPIKGVLMTQISNFILKSRNGYNEDYICKYLPQVVARESMKNHQIWMKSTKLLNDQREQKVIPELFQNTTWIKYDWARNIDFSETRTYYVSSFSKSVCSKYMQDEYGQCLYGYKNDRISELIAPIGICHLKKKKGIENDMPETLERPYIGQVIAFDVLYNENEAREELQYLFSIIDLFNINDVDKKRFLEEIMQYWILSVKDPKWENERERRYVVFLYEDYDYREIEIDDTFLKVKTTIFLMPDFIIGENPSKMEIMHQLGAKRHALSSKKYLLCNNCLFQDFDAGTIEMPNKCPVCGSGNIRMIKV